MHIPDGWLSLFVSLLTWAFTLLAIGLASSRFKKNEFEKISNIGAIASVVFVAQMFNFPVAGGTSGHLLGASLSVYVVGLPGAVITLFVVLLVQAFVFADGGILALGANTFNMGVAGTLTAWAIIKLFSKFGDKENKKLFLIGAFVSAFSAVIVASFFAGLELSLSGTAEFSKSIPLILFWHTIIGIGEGTLTVFIITYMMQTGFPLANETMVDSEQPFIDAVKESNKPVFALSILLGILSILALFASSSPDGLEFVGISQDFGEGSAFGLGLADDYAFLGMENVVGTILSAILGVIILSGLFILPVFYVKSKNEELYSPQ